MRQVNTMQPRDTRSLVAAVGQRLQQHPSVFTPLLDALGAPYSAHCCTRSFTPLLAPGAASDEALQLLQTSPLPSDWYLSPYPPLIHPSPPLPPFSFTRRFERVCTLCAAAHGTLSAIGVGHRLLGAAAPAQHVVKQAHTRTLLQMASSRLQRRW